MGESTRFRDQIVNLLEFAERPPERYQLPLHARAVLERALEHCLANANRTHVADELSNVMALVLALQTELESPGVAEEVRAVLRSDPRAVRALREKYAEKDALDEARRFQQQEGREVVLTAPVMARPASRSTIKLADMIDPCARTRTHSRPR